MTHYQDIHSISELHALTGYAKPTYPLVTIVDLTKWRCKYPEPEPIHYRLNFYAITYKQFTGQLSYGRGSYDFTEGSLMFTAPMQVLSPNPGIDITEGWGLYIHPDFFNASLQAKKLTHYSFFGYETNEALHISETEKAILLECLDNIKREITQNIDQHSYELILRNISLLLAYSNRFYERQFLTRRNVNHDVVERFEQLLDELFTLSGLIEHGVPDVKYLAEKMNLSPNYLTDLLAKYTGKSTQEHIHLKLIDQAKSMLWGTDQSVSEIAFQLGFEHLSHFSKLFKTKTGQSPKAFRAGNLN